MRVQNFLKAALAGVAIGLVGLGVAATLEGCGSDGADATGGKRVILHTSVGIDDAALTRFTTALGWNVELSQAAISAGPFYYFDGAPPLVLQTQHNAWQYAARWLGLGIAHAHPGHYQPGNAMGQMLESSSVDLLAGAAEFPDGDGVTGTYRSARFTFAEPSGPAKKLLDGHVALVEGSAAKDGQATRYFRAYADLTDVEEHASKGQVEGCELTKVDVQGDGTIMVKVNPHIWFNLVDFTSADEGSADSPADLPADSDARIGFVLGVTQLSAYKFSYLPE